MDANRQELEREIRQVEELIEDLEQVLLRLMRIAPTLEWYNLNQATQRAKEYYRKELVRLKDLYREM